MRSIGAYGLDHFPISHGHHGPSFKILVSSSVNPHRPSIPQCPTLHHPKHRRPLLQRQIPSHLSLRTLLRSSCLSVSRELHNPCILRCTLRIHHGTRPHRIISIPPRPAIIRPCPVSRPPYLRHPRLHPLRPILSPLPQRLPPL